MLWGTRGGGCGLQRTNFLQKDHLTPGTFPEAVTHSFELKTTLSIFFLFCKHYEIATETTRDSPKTLEAFPIIIIILLLFLVLLASVVRSKVWHTPPMEHVYSYGNTEQQYARHSTNVSFKLSSGTGPSGLVAPQLCRTYFSKFAVLFPCSNKRRLSQIQIL